MPHPLRPAAWSEQVLLERLQARDERAVHELYARFAPQLVRDARRMRVQAGLRQEVVCDVLHAVHDTLVRPEATAPRSLSSYAGRALRRRVLLLDQLARAEHVSLEEAMHVADDSTPDHDDGESAPPAKDGRASHMARLATAVATALTAEERQLLAWLAEHVPQREIARWRGVEFGAMRARILRLREKARAIAMRWVASRPPAERAALAKRLDQAARPPMLDSTQPARPRPNPNAGTPGDTDDAT